MDLNQKLLVALLSAAIRNTMPQDIEKNFDMGNIDWESIYTEACAHQVHAIIYPVIKDLNIESGPSIQLKTKWQNLVMQSAMMQIQHIKRMETVLKAFNEAGIPVIALKGLVLRELYPTPEFRTMGDADILIQDKDLIPSQNLLHNMGYTILSSDSKHIHFDHELYPSIELHKYIINYENFSNVHDIEKGFWNNAIEDKMCDAAIFKLAPEDQLLHLCVHMAMHLKNGGFILRQLCDLLVTVNHNFETIDWDVFMNKVIKDNIHDFTRAIFEVCNKLIGIQVPKQLMDTSLINEPNIDALIDDLFYNMSLLINNKERLIRDLQLHFSVHGASDKFQEELQHVLSLIFPTSKKLGKRYSYAKKHPFLIPVAWIHRIIWCLIRNDLTLKDKREYLHPNKKEKIIIRNRSKLLNWLQLRQ